MLKYGADAWQILRGARLFITGGTGFFGVWLLESLRAANRELGCGISALVLTRDPASFSRKFPHLAEDAAISFHRGDVRDFVFPEGLFDAVLHAATTTRVGDSPAERLQVFDAIVAGTRRVLDFTVKSEAGRVLYISSGAVYGAQPAEMTHVEENYTGGPETTDPRAFYAEGKRAAEQICVQYAEADGLTIPIARPFAFVGPHLPLGAHFAVGNFLRDALRGGPIKVNGDGTPYRSYLHAADLAVWLWTILARGESMRAYNVGSEEAITIADLAHATAALRTPAPIVNISQPPSPGLPARYVPSTRRAREELGLQTRISLHEALGRTLEWYEKLLETMHK